MASRRQGRRLQAEPPRIRNLGRDSPRRPSLDPPRESTGLGVWSSEQCRNMLQQHIEPPNPPVAPAIHSGWRCWDHVKQGMRSTHPGRDTIRLESPEARSDQYALFLVSGSGPRLLPLPTSESVVVGTPGVLNQQIPLGDSGSRSAVRRRSRMTRWSCLRELRQYNRARLRAGWSPHRLSKLRRHAQRARPGRRPR
jgi:hypothetical protein